MSAWIRPFTLLLLCWSCGASDDEKQFFSLLKNLNLSIFKVNVCSELQMWCICGRKTLALQGRPDIHFQVKVNFFWKTVVMDGTVIR